MFRDRASVLVSIQFYYVSLNLIVSFKKINVTEYVTSDVYCSWCMCACVCVSVCI